MKTASAPALWGQPGRAPAPGAETHLRARRESGQTCLGMMQGRGQIPTSQIARGRPGPARPSGGGLRASDAPLNLGAGTEPGVGRGPRRARPGRSEPVRPTSLPQASPAPLPGSPQRQAPGPAAAGAAGACERGQVPSPAPVSQCGRRLYGVEGPW